MARQLHRALAGFERGNGEAGDDETLVLCRGYLDHALALAWRGVCSGDLDAPRTLLKPLLVVQVVARRLAPEPVSPQARAAAWVEGVVHALRLGDEALEAQRVSARLEDPQRSGLERAVLDVLAGAGGYLRRGEVYARLDAASRPTRVRVGQVLNELHHDGLLLRTRRRARGNRDTRFYALSQAGRTLFKRLRLPRLVAKAVEVVFDVNAQERAAIARGLIANSRTPHVRLLAKARIAEKSPEAQEQFRPVHEQAELVRAYR